MYGLGQAKLVFGLQLSEYLFSGNGSRGGAVSSSVQPVYCLDVFL